MPRKDHKLLGLKIEPARMGGKYMLLRATTPEGTFSAWVTESVLRQLGRVVVDGNWSKPLPGQVVGFSRRQPTSAWGRWLAGAIAATGEFGTNLLAPALAAVDAEMAAEAWWQAESRLASALASQRWRASDELLAALRDLQSWTITGEPPGASLRAFELLRRLDHAAGGRL